VSDATRIGFVHFTPTTDHNLVEVVHDALRELAETSDYSLELTDANDLAEMNDAILRLLQAHSTLVVTVGEDAGRVAEAMAPQYREASFITVDYEPGKVETKNVFGVRVDGARAEEAADAVKEQVKRTIQARTERPLQAVFERLMAWNLPSAVVPALAIITALIIGAIFIVAFDPDIWEAFGQGIGVGLAASVRQIGRAYGALLQGAFGDPIGAVRGLIEYFQTGNDATFRSAIYPLTESLRISTPYIFTGLAVALGFRAGLFNIGGEGQYFLGGLASTFIGYAVTGLPMFIHLPLALLAGFAGGSIWAAIAGWLKAQTGAHEVITTIMLNYIAFRLADFLLSIGGPMARPDDPRPISPPVLPSAWLPQFFPNSVAIRLNFGLILALLAVVAVWYLLFKTSLGFEFRTVGSNPRAGRTAGINVKRIYVVVMALSGGLAGLAGAHDVLGVTRYMPNAFQSGYGFDAIALALLGRNHPVGVLAAALLFGFLRSGAQRMQAFAAVPIDIISILQGLIIIFIAAPEVIRMIYRIRTSTEGTEVVTTGWS